MATSYEYPFVNFDLEIFTRVPGAHVANDINSIKVSFPIGKDRLVDVIGEDIWDLMINHYNDTDNYNQDGQTDLNYIRLDKLVSRCQDSMIQFVYYEHFIFLMLHISDAGVTVKKSDEETTAFKYLTDEAKEKFIENAWTYTSMLLKFLDEEASNYTTWAKTTDYVTGQIITESSKYYRSKDDHTSGDTFAADAAHWTEIPKSFVYTDWLPDTDYLINDPVRNDNIYYTAKAGFKSGATFEIANWDVVTVPAEVIFWQWTESDEYKASKNLIFDDYKDFNKHYLIDKSAYFYNKVGNFINDTMNIEISARLETFPELLTEIQENNVSADHQALLKLIKYATAYRIMGRATIEFSYFEFPRAIRYDFSNEMSKNQSIRKGNSDFFRKNLSGMFNQKADEYFSRLEQEIALQAELEEDPHTEDYDVETAKYDQDEDDKFTSIF